MKTLGFTLIEMMIVVVVIAILAAIAYPSYTQFILRSEATKAETRMLDLAQLLESHKSKNFSYKGFPISSELIGDPWTYRISIVGGVGRDADDAEVTESIATSGSSWTIKAISRDARNYSFLMNSKGLKCKNKLSTNITFSSCGDVSDGSENW